MGALERVAQADRRTGDGDVGHIDPSAHAVANDVAVHLDAQVAEEGRAEVFQVVRHLGLAGDSDRGLGQGGWHRLLQWLVRLTLR